MPSYGPKGEFIILATLGRIFKDTLSALVYLSSTLEELFHNETVDLEPGDLYHHFWEGAVFVNSPISLRDFFEYILLPETATRLIAQDLEISIAEATGMWAQSRDFGNAFNDNTDDGAVDDINNENIKAQVVSCFISLCAKSFDLMLYFSALEW